MNNRFILRVDFHKIAFIVGMDSALLHLRRKSGENLAADTAREGAAAAGTSLRRLRDGSVLL